MQVLPVSVEKEKRISGSRVAGTHFTPLRGMMVSLKGAAQTSGTDRPRVAQALGRPAMGIPVPLPCWATEDKGALGDWGEAGPQREAGFQKSQVGELA